MSKSYDFSYQEYIGKVLGDVDTFPRERYSYVEKGYDAIIIDCENKNEILTRISFQNR